MEHTVAIMVTSFDNNYCLIAEYMPLVNPCIVPLHTGGQLPASMPQGENIGPLTT